MKVFSSVYIFFRLNLNGAEFGLKMFNRLLSIFFLCFLGLPYTAQFVKINGSAVAFQCAENALKKKIVVSVMVREKRLIFFGIAPTIHSMLHFNWLVSRPSRRISNYQIICLWSLVADQCDGRCKTTHIIRCRKADFKERYPYDCFTMEIFYLRPPKILQFRGTLSWLPSYAIIWTN